MQILVVVGHPHPASFNHALAHTVVETAQALGHPVIFHDLHAENFDPLLPQLEIPEDGDVPPLIQQHCDELRAADGIIIVHPNWWGQPPAILKGWIDRVFRPGVAYDFEDGDSGEGAPIGLLNARAALVLNTSNTSDKREHGIFGDPLELLWKNCIFDLCGVTHVERRMFNIIVTSTPEQRQAWLDETAALVQQVFPADAVKEL